MSTNTNPNTSVPNASGSTLLENLTKAAFNKVVHCSRCLKPFLVQKAGKFELLEESDARRQTHCWLGCPDCGYLLVRSLVSECPYEKVAAVKARAKGYTDPELELVSAPPAETHDSGYYASNLQRPKNMTMLMDTLNSLTGCIVAADPYYVMFKPTTAYEKTLIDSLKDHIKEYRILTANPGPLPTAEFIKAVNVMGKIGIIIDELNNTAHANTVPVEKDVDNPVRAAIVMDNQRNAIARANYKKETGKSMPTGFIDEPVKNQPVEKANEQTLTSNYEVTLNSLIATLDELKAKDAEEQVKKDEDKVHLSISKQLADKEAKKLKNGPTGFLPDPLDALTIALDKQEVSSRKTLDDFILGTSMVTGFTEDMYGTSATPIVVAAGVEAQDSLELLKTKDRLDVALYELELANDDDTAPTGFLEDIYGNVDEYEDEDDYEEIYDDEDEEEEEELEDEDGEIELFDNIAAEAVKPSTTYGFVEKHDEEIPMAILLEDVPQVVSNKKPVVFIDKVMLIGAGVAACIASAAWLYSLML